MSYPTCDHLMADGVFCSSPALRNQHFCYYHLDLRARRVQMAQARRKGESCRLRLPVLDNMHAVQVGLQQVGDALADDRIDFRRANALLYLLQQVAANLNNTRKWEGRRPQVEFAEPLRALEAHDVAQEYELPANVDLALSPDAALDAAQQPHDITQQPKERRSLPRNPARAVQLADKYFHIPKDPRAPMTHDETAYTLSRWEVAIADATADDDDAADDGPPPPAPAPVVPQKAADVA